MSLTASDIASMTRCPHRVYMDRFGNPAERVPYPEFLQILWESGRLHEYEVVSGLDFVSPAGDDLQSRSQSTLQLMSNGAPLIYHAVLGSDELTGEPDLLKRVEHPSRLGAHSYVPVKIKAGRAWEDPKAKTPKAKPHYIAQLCAYAELLGVVQGVTPTTGYVIDSEGDWVPLDLTTFWSEYGQLRETGKRLAAGEQRTLAGKKAACDQCVWFDVCDRDIRNRDDVTLVAGVGDSHRGKLAEVGVRTVRELANAEPSLLITVKGIGPAFAQRWTRQARVQKVTSAEIREPWAAPAARFDVSYDIEDFMLDGTVYLHGLLLRPAAATRFGEPTHAPTDFGRYDGICATAGESEETVWRRFLERLEELDALGDYVVYVYTSHDRTHLARLRSHYGSSAALDHFADRFVDLYQVARDHFVFPTESTGLKSLAAFCGFTWRDSDPGGSQSIAWWAYYLEDPIGNAALRDRVIAYNEDDVRASLALRDWMERTSSGAFAH